MLRFAAAVLAAFLLTQPARAEFILPFQHFCFDGAEAVAMLKNSGALTSHGLMTEQLGVQLRTKPDGSYVIALVSAKGRACIMVMGTDWSDPKSGDEL